MNDIREPFAVRIGGKGFGGQGETYKFEKIKRSKREAVEKNPGRTLIDLGVGEPDEPADPAIVRVLTREAGKPENRFYSDNGILEFKEAASRYLGEVYGLTDIDPETEIIHGIGSKPVLAMLPLCFIDPGDVALVTVPGYPVVATYTKYAGGRVFPLPLLEENGFLPDFKSIPPEILAQAKLLYINYPNNPTGVVASIGIFDEIVAFASTNNIVVIHDASYSALVYDGRRPLAFLSASGAKKIGIEVFSLSKAFNMTGWRLAFVAGNDLLVKAYGTIKDNTDSGQFRAIQKAGVYALDHPELTARVCEKYSRRLDLLVGALCDLGFNARKPGGSFYCYVPSPSGTKSGIRFNNAFEASDYILKEALISTVPEDDAGHYLRFSVTFEAHGKAEELRVIAEMKKRLSGLGLCFEKRDSE